MTSLVRTRIPVCTLALLLAAVASAAQPEQPTPTPSSTPSTPPADTPSSTPTPTQAPAPGASEAAPGEHDHALQLALDPSPKWTVQVEPVAWFAGPAGQLKLPGVNLAPGGGEDDIELADLNLDSSRLSPGGELHINAGRWRFSFSGADYSVDQETTANANFTIGSVNVLNNDALRTSFDQTTVQLTAGYLVYAKDFAAACESPLNACPTQLRVYLLGGGRLMDLDVRVESLVPSRAGTAGTDQFYAEIIVGGRAELEIAEDFTIDLELSGGGMGDSDRSIASFDIIAGFQWRPIENVGVQIGWRQLAYWLSDGEGDDEFSLDGETAGVYFGVVVRF